MAKNAARDHYSFLPKDAAGVCRLPPRTSHDKGATAVMRLPFSTNFQNWHQSEIPAGWRAALRQAPYPYIKLTIWLL